MREIAHHRPVTYLEARLLISLEESVDAIEGPALQGSCPQSCRRTKKGPLIEGSFSSYVDMAYALVTLPAFRQLVHTLALRT